MYQDLFHFVCCGIEFKFGNLSYKYFYILNLLIIFIS